MQNKVYTEAMFAIPIGKVMVDQKICDELKINISDLTSKSDVNMINTISVLLDDQLFEDLAILGPEVSNLLDKIGLK